MSLVSSRSTDVAAKPGVLLDAAAIDSVMAVHRATFAKLVANEFDTFLLIAFFEDAAATYQSLASRLRGTTRP